MSKRSLFKLGRLSFLLSFILGTACVFQISYSILQNVKTSVTMHLLQDAWQHTLRTQQPSKPWPWAHTWPVARLSVPEHQVDLIVLNSGSGNTLAIGPEYHTNSSEPSGSGKIIISARLDSQFQFVQILQLGDSIFIQKQNGISIEYLVSNIQLVDTADYTLHVNQYDSTLILVSCCLQINSQNKSLVGYVVSARQALPEILQYNQRYFQSLI